ncbi:MAG: hypothetical protein ACRDBG_06145 [Waterburya sp.]
MTFYDDDLDYTQAQNARMRRRHNRMNNMIEDANDAAMMDELEDAYHNNPERFMELMKFQQQLASEGAEAYKQAFNATEEDEKPKKRIAFKIPGFGRTIDVKSKRVD